MFMYGQELTQEQLREAHEHRLEHHNLIDLEDAEAYRAGEPMEQHSSVGWKGHRDGYYDSMVDDYVIHSSWSFSKIVRPSTDRNLCVRLNVFVSGKKAKRGNRVRPNRWSATVSIGRRGHPVQLVDKNPPFDWKERRYLEPTLPIGRCKSCADAMRQADQLDIEDAIQEVLATGYSKEESRCYYLKTADGWEPFLTAFPVEYFNDSLLPSGEYLTVGEGPDGNLKGIRISRSYWGTVSSYGKDEDQEAARELGIWWKEAG